MTSMRGSRRGERAMVTVELAIGFLTVAVLATCLAGLSLLGVAQATVSESSAQLARQAARADEVALREARARAPEGAVIDVRRGGDGVTATVTMAVAVPGIGPVEVAATSWAAYEPGSGP
ncbi:hypothetical protein H5398_04345 [Tessaracoccus sp. MC1679]|uniref:hypothetical protein n=1 Tax=Tessaracoccus sp. MC1679 TaxID=2760313 RepID=UPI00160078E7|nr:hypothetical protein [Tessaracoccus sp. MC1679]MBB1515208.1 hypothetical protein [Tessaracoccus sp. MC1679]